MAATYSFTAAGLCSLQATRSVASATIECKRAMDVADNTKANLSNFQGRGLLAWKSGTLRGARGATIKQRPGFRFRQSSVNFLTR